MEYIIIILVLIIAILSIMLVRKNIVIKTLIELEDITFKEKVRAKNHNSVLKNEINDIIKELQATEVQYKKYITLLITSNIKVYTQSNFYAAHSFFNNRFYAKINSKEKNNKAEGIPVIEVPNNKNAVINLYDLSYALKYHPTSDIDTMIKDSTVLKEVLIEELNNKVLKTYRR